MKPAVKFCSYLILIFFCGTFLTKYADGSCSQTVFAQPFIQHITSPNWPNSYPSNLDCEWTITSLAEENIIIEFLDISLTCCIDVIKVFDGNELVGMPIHTVKGTGEVTHFPSPYVSSTSSISVRLMTYDLPSKASGFRIAYRIANHSSSDSSPMGFNMFLTGSTNITSPNYPKNYTENSNTFWTFAAPIGEQLQFKVTEMLIEPCCDYLKLTDGLDERLIAKLGKEGVKKDTMFQTTTGILKVTFHTDYSINHQGFHASLSTIPRKPLNAKACGFTDMVTNQTTIFNSPSYPYDYPSNMDCNWLLKSPYNGWQVLVVFEDFRSEDCCDHLEVFDGTSFDSQLLATIKDKWNPHNYRFISSQGSLYLRFISDTNVNYRGFSGYYTLIEVPTPRAALHDEAQEIIEEVLPMEVSCFTGFALSGDGFQQDMQTLTQCPSGSSCLHATASIFDDTKYGNSNEIRISYGQCLPVHLCETYSCEQMQESLPPSIPSSFHECAFRCCNEDMCNQQPELKTINDVSGAEQACQNDDLAFLPGCTYRELHNQATMCFSLFFNEFPYTDPITCSRNLQLYQLCMYSVDEICFVGMKPVLFGLESESLSDELWKFVTSEFVDFSTIIHPSYELFCNNVKETPNEKYGGLFSFLSYVITGDSNHCGLTERDNITQNFIYLREQLIHVQKTADFCRLFDYLKETAMEVYRRCDVSSFIDYLNINDQNLHTKLHEHGAEIYRMSFNLLAEVFLPQCLALRTSSSK
ncbi:uncharacterized protein LOC143468203 [Clavelina lepadiformis]|uniref:CUB domain-containing protein n=1 Tax=Clavelina lepadiformis TaxID=159417 RepID=A0ABP0F1L4_CLALP